MPYRKNQNVIIQELQGSNENYFEQAFNRINDNNDYILKSHASNFWIGQIVGGRGTSIASAGANNSLPSTATNAQMVDLGDGIPRYAVKVRLISDVFFPGNAKCWTNVMPNPFAVAAPGHSEWTASLHPTAYTENSKVQVPEFGAYVAIRDYGGVLFIERIINKTQVNIAISGTTSTTNQFNQGTPLPIDPKIARLIKKHGLKPKKGTYNGIAANGGSIPIENGYPRGFGKITKLPSQKHANTKYRGKGHLLIDFVPSFEKLAEAFHAHFNKKLVCSALRDFPGQIAARAQSIRNNVHCKTQKDPYSGRAGYCGTAIAGGSPHGWGVAIDIYNNGSHIKKRAGGNGKDQYDWMVANAARFGWEHPEWAQNAPGKEDHHWQPKWSLVSRVLSYPGKGK